jgi:hypothetical protein
VADFWNDGFPTQGLLGTNIWPEWTDYDFGATTATTAPKATPVTPNYDPKIDANALYGKPMALFTGGFARIGSGPAPLVGPYLADGRASFVVSFGVPSNPEGNRKIYAIYLDNELAWSAPSGGTVPADGTFHAEAFDFIFKPGTLTQSVCSLETLMFPGDEIAYRPQMLLQILDIPYARFVEKTNKPVPYVACDIGDVTDGANPLDGINLGEALERVAWSPWAGYSSTTFESIGVTDVVDAILQRDNFTVVDLCRSVTSEYRNLDLIQSDKLYIKDRAAVVTPDFTFDRDSIIGGEEAITITRGSATNQKREHEFIAIDPGQDYTAGVSLAKIPRDPVAISAAVGKDTNTSPLVIDANTRQSLAVFSQNYLENARRKIAFSVGVSGYEIEPGDLFRLTNLDVDGISDEIWKCIETTHGANWIVEIVGEAVLYCSLDEGSAESAYLGFHEASGTNSSYNFGSCDIGVAAADRLVVVVATGTKDISPPRAVTAVTIGGNAATIHHHTEEGDAGVSANPSMSIAIASLAVPSGSAATIAITLAGNVDGGCIAVYALYGLVSATPHATAADHTVSSNPSTSINVPAEGVVIAGYGGRGGSPGSAVWTGLNNVHQNESFPGPSSWSSSASQTLVSAQTGRSISVTAPATGPEVLIAASWS